MKSYRPFTIFLAEDNPDDIEITRRAFKRSSAASKLVVARDGEEALKLLEGLVQPEGGGVDLALLDINLPRLNGLEVLSRLRARDAFAATPVIMMSASSREEDVRESYRLGANSYIQKPVIFDQFVEVLCTLTKYWFEVCRLPAGNRSPT